MYGFELFKGKPPDLLSLSLAPTSALRISTQQKVGDVTDNEVDFSLGYYIYASVCLQENGYLHGRDGLYFSQDVFLLTVLYRLICCH